MRHANPLRYSQQHVFANYLFFSLGKPSHAEHSLTHTNNFPPQLSSVGTNNTQFPNIFHRRRIKQQQHFQRVFFIFILTSPYLLRQNSLKSIFVCVYYWTNFCTLLFCCGFSQCRQRTTFLIEMWKQKSFLNPRKNAIFWIIVETQGVLFRQSFWMKTRLSTAASRSWKLRRTFHWKLKKWEKIFCFHNFYQSCFHPYSWKNDMKF